MRGGELSANGKWFVGRASELAAIGACVDAVSGGAGRLAWVEGDPGSGKTALVNRVVAELPPAFVVLRAAADESTADQPFAVLEQLGIEGGGSPQAVGLDLVALLTEAAVRGPVAVVVEDLHWADRESRQALLTVVRRVGHPVQALEALLGTGFVTWWPGEASTPACFTHPLYRAALYADLAPTRRRELHRAAAESLGAASALRHRVAAAEGIDDDLARDLDESAAGRAGEGARSVAATYLLWASSVGSDPQLNERRVLRAARLLLQDGQTARAAELRGRVEGCGEGPLRSLVLGQLAWEQGASTLAESWLIEASKPTAGSEPDGEVAAAALAHLGTLYHTQGRGQEAVDAATRLLALSNLPGELERSGWIALAAGTAADQGASAGLDLLASRLPQPAESVPAADADLLIVRGALGFYAGRTTAAIADLRAAIRLARHGAAAAQLPRAHVQLSQLLLSSGEWDEALVHARAALSLVSAERRVWMDAQVHAALTRLFGGRGEWQRADEHLAGADAAAAEAGTIEAVVTTRVAQAAVARARNDPEQVVKILAPLVENPRLIPMSTSLATRPTTAS
jgi:tetratricopeptide (TPR) repeat protein